MTVYARSDLNFISVGGAGHDHSRPYVQGLKTAAPVLDKTFAITCPVCEPELLKDPACFATREDQVPLTEDEKIAAEAETKTGNTLIAQMAKEMARAGQEAVREMRNHG